MFAWILNTMPVILSSVACTTRDDAAWSRGGGAIGDERVEKIAHSEVLQCRTEIDRRQMTFEKGVALEGMAGVAHQRQFIAPAQQLLG